MPEADTRVVFTPEDGKLALSWEEGDCIRVTSGSSSSVFTISRIISAHEAEFTGPEVTGSSFEILCPGTYPNWDAADDDVEIPAQKGNGSSEHLRYKAFLDEVDTYNDIAFSSAWAEEHGGYFREAAAVKLQAKLPEGVSTLKKAALRIDGINYILPLENVDISADDQVLTAYMMLSWDDIELPDGARIPVSVTASDNEVYSTVLTISGEKVIQGGKMNSFTGVKLALQDFLDGDGTQYNPYLIASTHHLESMMKLYKNAAAPADKTSFKYWFKMLEDVDASSIDWTPLNGTDQCYNASFAGVLYGSIRNVIFDGAVVNPSTSTKKGVVAGYLGTIFN